MTALIEVNSSKDKLSVTAQNLAAITPGTVGEGMFESRRGAPQRNMTKVLSSSRDGSDHLNSLRKRSDTQSFDILPRSIGDEEGQVSEVDLEKARQFRREYDGPDKREKRARDGSAETPREVRERYEDLKSAFNRVRRESGARNMYGPTQPRVDPALFTPEEIEMLRKKSNVYSARYYGSDEAQATRRRLSSRQGDAAELAEYDDLRKAHLEYRRWLRWNRTQVAGDYTDEERAIMAANREGYLIYRREFSGSKYKNKRDRLEAGQGKPEEIARYLKARNQARAYALVKEAHIRTARKGELEVDEIELEPRDLEDIERLEALRKDRNEYQQKYGTADKAGKRDEVERGIGDPEEIERYPRLKEAALEYNRVYPKFKRRLERTIREADRKASEPDKPLQDPDPTTTVTLSKEGRPRWMVKLMKRMREKIAAEQAAKEKNNQQSDILSNPSSTQPLKAVNHHAQNPKATQQAGTFLRSAADRVVNAFLKASKKGEAVGHNPVPSLRSVFQSAARASL